MKRAIAINCILAVWVFGCETKPAEGFRRVDEQGKVRCGYLDEKDELGNLQDFHCDVLSEDKGWCCSGPSTNPADAVCMSDEECQIQQEKPGIVWRAECDDPSDCPIKYPNKYPDAGVEDWACCESFALGHRWSLCRLKEECPHIENDQNEGCLSTWTCPEGTVCLESPFTKNVYYCQEQKEEE